MTLNIKDQVCQHHKGGAGRSETPLGLHCGVICWNYEVTEQPVPIQPMLVQTSSKVLIMYNRTVFLGRPSSSLPSLPQTQAALPDVKE